MRFPNWAAARMQWAATAVRQLPKLQVIDCQARFAMRAFAIRWPPLFATRILLLLLYICSPAQTFAETRYVTDQAQIMMRKGESTRHKIIRTLPSGEAIEELAVNASTGYSKIQTEDGITGFVLTRQLQEKPVARSRLAAMEASLAELQKTPDQLAKKLAELQSKHDALRRSHEELQGEKNRLEQELASIAHASSNVLQITEERGELRRSVANLTRQVTRLRQESHDLENQTNQRWFLIGAGVITGGILIGLLLPHLRFRRRKSSWASF